MEAKFMPIKNFKKNLSEENVFEELAEPIAQKGGVGRAFAGQSRNFLKRYWLLALIAVAVLTGLAYVVSVQRENRLAREELNKIKSGSQEFAKQEAEQILEQLNKLIILPSGEQPTIATVTDIDKLKDQPFFQNGRVGDKVIIYSQAQKAILFRPSENKIVEVAPFAAQPAGPKEQAPESSEKNPAQSQPGQLIVEVRNGSGKSGAAGDLKEELSVYSDISVIKTGNAKGLYEKTLIVNLSGGKNPESLQRLKQIAAGDLSLSLPEGESSTQADVVVILGKQ